MTPDDEAPVTLHKPESNEWPALVGRIVGDLTRIFHTEIQLFQASLNPILSAAVDRLLGSVLALVAFIAGGLCLLIAFVVFLQKWVGWDAALLVAGIVSLVAGYLCARVASIRANRSILELERSFSREAKHDAPR